MKSIKQYWDNLIHSIEIRNDKQYTDKIAKLQKEIVNCKKDFANSLIINGQLIDKYDKLISKNQILTRVNNQLVKENFELKPKPILKPEWLIGTMVYKPKRRIVAKGIDKIVKFAYPQDAFDKSVMLNRLMKKEGLINIPKTYQNMRRVVEFGLQFAEYTNDKSENWRPVTETIMGRMGDCEDTSILIVSALGLAGWNASEVWVDTGWFTPNLSKPKTKFGHAWVRALCNDEWWIIESTDKSNKITRLGLAKNYDPDWGCCNWKWNGIINGGYETLFN